MSKINVPAEYNQVMPYLILPDAVKFETFMKIIFGAKEKMKMMRDEHVIMHAELLVGEMVIMYAQSTAEYPPTPGSFFIYVTDADSTYGEALKQGAISVQEPTDKEYGRSAGVKDSNGNTWWITSVK